MEETIAAFKTWAAQIPPIISAWAQATENAFVEWKQQCIQDAEDWAVGMEAGVQKGLNDIQQDIDTWITARIDDVKNFFGEIRDTFMVGLNDVKGVVSEALIGIQNIWQTITKKVEDIWTEHKTAILVTAGLIALAILTIATCGLDLLVPAAVTVGKVVVKTMSGWAVSFGARAALAATAIGSKFSSLGETIKEGLSDIPGVISSALSKAGDIYLKFKDFLVGNTEAVAEIVAEDSSAGPTAQIFQFPTNTGTSAVPEMLRKVSGLAAGGIRDKESLVRIAENGREAVVPLSGGAMIPFAQAVAAEMIKMGGSNGAHEGIVLQVGTLIASPQSYKELERKLKTIRLGETSRGVV